MRKQPKKPLVFICHESEASEPVRKLYAYLKTGGFVPWLGESDIPAGGELAFETKRAINSADFALVCLSKNSTRKRGHFNKTLKWIMDRQDETYEGDIFMIPVRIETCELPDRLADLQPVDLFSSDGQERLIRAMKPGDGQNGTVSAYTLSDANPFYFGGAVPSRLFYGRNEILRSIAGKIGGPNLQSVSIVGERRMGKSSLLVYVKDELAGQLPPDHAYAVVYLDLMKSYCRTRKGLMRYMRRELAKIWREPWPKDEDGELEAFDFAVEDINDENIRLILCLDEVENLAKRAEEFDDVLEDWRANAQMGQIGMITASARPLADMCGKHELTSPFFNIFSQARLGLLKSDAWQSLIRDNMPVDENDLRFIEENTGGHPFFTQMAASLLWEKKQKGNPDYINDFRYFPVASLKKFDNS